MFIRHLEAVFGFLPGRPVLVLTGARRVGKTTFLKRWSSLRPEGVRWVDGDDPAERVRWQRLLAGQGPEEWLEVLLGRSPTSERPALLVIDEAQALRDVSVVVKHLTDRVPGLRVVLSGSSALVLKALAAESLAGRKLLWEMHPLSFTERIDPTRVTGVEEEDRQRLTPHLLEMLAWGGFPELPSLPSDEQRARALREVVDSVLRRDLVDFLRDRDAGVLESILVDIARGVGGRLNTSNLASRAGISRPTVVRYLNLLVEAGLVFLLPGMKASGVVPKAQPKAYLMDSGILSVLLHDSRPFELRRPEDQGALLENFLLTELVKLQGIRGDLGQLGYLWDEGAEVDFVVQRDGALVEAIEVKRGHGRTVRRRGREALAGLVPRVFRLENAAVELLRLWGPPGSLSRGDTA
ncbi:ATP-binding protein [Myxococcota bacterium]|nr:ATP-binding protein [Myxococcota bacterium]